MSDDRVARELRRAYPSVLARVLAKTRDLGDAEDAVQDASLRALASWAREGMPDSPEAWLTSVATNRWLDGMRRRRREARHGDALSALAEARPWPCAIDRGRAWEDEMLGLVFTACDPLLERGEAAALTLATVVGLSAAEIANAFVVKPRTMEQRLTRARLRLRERGDGYAAAGAEPERLAAVLAVIHLVFNEGYWSRLEDQPIRRNLCELAIGLARSLVLALPQAHEAAGLLAVLLLHHARSAARIDAGGRAVPLPEQDRSLWDRSLIDEGAALLDRALANHAPGPYQIEAAIAAVHCRAPSADATEWPRIAALYAELERQRPSPVVRVNRAFAVARADGAARGLALLDEAAAALAELDYPYAHVVRGVLLGELGRHAEAVTELERASLLARNHHERAEIEARLGEQRLRVTPR